MNYIFFLAGISTLSIAYIDFLYTTLSTEGAGFLSGRLTKIIWQVLLRISKRKGSHKLLSSAGMICITAILIMWIALLWMGHSFIFCSDPNSVLNNTTRAPASIIEKFYFAGYTLSTLGLGDFSPNNDFWKIFTVIVSFSGLSMLTIAITYLVQVLSAEIDKRQLSLYIATLGGTPQDILLNGWNGKNFKKLEADFEGLTSLILSHSQHHMAYPVLHHFHSTVIRESTAVNLVALDEALTILIIYIPDETRPHDLNISSLRKALTTYLLTLENDFIKPSPHVLTHPDLSRLKEHNIPLIEDEEFIKKKYKQIDGRRKLLMGLLENDGWTWNDLNKPKFKSELDLTDD